MDVNEAAIKLGVSPRRVRALIGEGRVLAHRSGKTWNVEALPASRGRRPLSPTSRAQLAKALHSRSLKGLSGQARARTAQRLNVLRTSSDPAAILLDWWGGRAEEKDAYVRNLLERALAGDASGVRETLRRRRPAYLATAERLSDRIRTERRIQGLTREDLAERAGVDVSRVLDLERGRPMRSPGPSRRILEALEITPSALPPIGGSS